MSESGGRKQTRTHRGENFPVASAIVSPRHRPAILAFYRFARAADDVADDRSLAPAEKHRLLDALEGTLRGEAAAADALPLRAALAARGIPADHPVDLLAAFRRDVEKRRYADWSELMDYCAFSAAPVGRFVLDIHDESRTTWPASDALCAALQVINHLQDCAKDFAALDRVYLPLDVLEAHGGSVADLGLPRATPALRAAIVELAERAGRLLETARPLAGQVRDRRLRVEIAVIQRLAEKLNDGLKRRDPLSQRVHLGKPAMLAVAAGAILRELSRGRSRVPHAAIPETRA